MSRLIAISKQIGGPGSIGFLVFCSAVGLLIAYIGPRSRRLAKVGLLLVFSSYLLAALPVVSHAIADSLPSYGPVWKPDGAGDSDILVVLSGDNAYGRARETRRVLDIATPRCVLVSGSRWFVRIVVDAGVARDRFVADDTTNTTREQIAKLAAWATECGAQRVILIASALSMPRVAALVPTAGVPVLLVPAPVDEAPATSGIRVAVPSYRALRVTREAFYEHVALAYYRHRGWIR
jgi:uncharacterized SAM-binding protein YcdF (DUF218 family)